jgi:adenosine deaminase
MRERMSHVASTGMNRSAPGMGIIKEIKSMDFSVYPKVELHLHLDCSLSYNVAHRINLSITEEAYLHDFIAPTKCTNLADFLTRALQGIALMQTEEQLRFVIFDLFEQLQRDHLLYAEIRFAPLLHTNRGLSPEQVVEVIEGATSQACESTGIEAQLILCTLRHFSPEQSHQTAKLVDRFRGTCVIEYLQKERIHLEVCPTSNLQTNIYDTFTDHPINRLYELGISLSVNTDAYTIADITLTGAYAKLHKVFAWDKQHFLRCNLEAIHASFLPETTRHQLAAQLQESYRTI